MIYLVLKREEKEKKKNHRTPTCAETLRSPDDVPSDSGYVNSAANSKPRGRYPVMKNLKKNTRKRWLSNC